MTEPIRCGDWILSDVLGEGLQGKVFLATHKDTCETSAIKFVFKDGMNEKDLKHLKNEIKAMQELKSLTPHVVQILQFEENARLGSKSAFAIRTELCNGGELFNYLMYSGRFEEKLARTYFLQLLEAVACMHAKKFVHRDIKAENILIHDGVLKLADFGFARRYQRDDDDDDDDDVKMTTQCGTPGYTAPEIMNCIRLDDSYTSAACDIFSSGVLLFIMLVGVPPMTNATRGDWWFDRLRERRYDRFWASHEQNGHVISDQAKDLIIRMLAPNPRDRPTVSQIKEHPFLKGAVRYTASQACAILREKKQICDRAVEEERLEEEAKSQFDPFASRPVYRVAASSSRTRSMCSDDDVVDDDKMLPPDLNLRNATCVDISSSDTLSWKDIEKSFSGFTKMEKLDTFTRVYEFKDFKVRVSLRRDKSQEVLQLHRLCGNLLEFNRVFCQVSAKLGGTAGKRYAMIPRSLPLVG